MLYFSLGRVHLNDIASIVDKPVLQKLKKEHGGLQTLLRNHCQIFEGDDLVTPTCVNCNVSYLTTIILKWLCVCVFVL